MSGTVRLYRSTDASAPSLNGNAGSLVTVLDAILVNGYGAMSAAGWSKPFAGTNRAVYRMATTAGNTGFYLDVNDAAPTVANEAQMRGYEVMTGIGVGTGPFPTTAQYSFGTILRKSNVTGTSPRPWTCIADDSCFYFLTDPGDYISPSYSTGFFFGDFVSYKAGDAYNCAIMGRFVENNGSYSYEPFPMFRTMASSYLLAGVDSGCYVARGLTGVGGSIIFNKFTSVLVADSAGAAWGTSGSTGCPLAYPNPADNALELAPAWIAHSGSVRGYFKGLWAMCQPQPLSHGDVFSGTGSMAGKSFVALNVKGINNLNGQIAIETSNTWS